ncbi:MAG TPA: TonB-dependent receptor [Sphingomicrobium sp.]|jgi:iron complex outermembrane receptor protein
MRVSTALLIGTSLFAVATPALSQTVQEDAAQAANQQQGSGPVTRQPSSGEEGEIIVTATKRASRVQEVPFSINAQTQADIQRAHAQTLEDISRNVAGLTVQNLGPGQSQVSVRGVSAGQIARDQPGVKEQVGTYLDETVTSLSLFTPDFDLFDLNRVETLRGPQGTLFGSGSVGGTLRYITNQPRTDRTEGTVEGDVNVLRGGDIGYSLRGAVNLPLSNTMAARIVGYGTHFGGFIDAVGPYSKKNVNDGDRIGTRVSLLFQPTPEFKLTPRFVYQKVEAGGFNREDRYIIFNNQFTTGGDTIGEREQYLLFREKFRDKTMIADLVASYDFGPAEVTSVSSYIDRDILVSRDASALTNSIYVSFTGYGGARGAALADLIPSASNLRDTTKLKQFTQELRLSSTGSGPFQWVIGGFYSKVDRKYLQVLPTANAEQATNLILQMICLDESVANQTCAVDAVDPANRVPLTAAQVTNGFAINSPYNSSLPYDIKQYAAFGEGTYRFGQFKLTAGARYYKFKETRDFVSGGVFSDISTNIGDSTSSDGISPRFIVSYEPNRNFSVNLQAAKGFRLGGTNDPLNVPLCTPQDLEIFGGQGSYKDETLWNYEAGVKFSRGGFTLNSAVFHNKIRNLQVTQTAGSCSSRVVFNVPKAHSTGIEAELSARPLPNLEFSLSGNVQNAKFDSTVLTGTGAVLGGIEEGNRLPTVPKFQVAASTTYSQPISSDAEWSVSGSVQRVGNRFGEPGDQVAGAGLVPNAIFFDPATGALGGRVNDIGSLRLPGYTLVNLSTAVHWFNGLDVSLYVKNLFDASPKLSIDRERGLRARFGYNIGQPRMIGLTVRKSWGAPVAVAAPTPMIAPPPPPPVAAPEPVAPPPPPPPPPAPVERGERG